MALLPLPLLFHSVLTSYGSCHLSNFAVASEINLFQNLECLKTFNLHQYEPNEKGGGGIFDGKILTYVHDQGGSRLSEFRKIPEDFENQRHFQWIFVKSTKISDKN